MDVLSNAVGGVKSGGLALDLQVIPPHPVVESGGVVVCKVDGSPLFRRADAAVAAVDALVAAGTLAEEAVDDHDVLTHYRTGADLVDDFAPKERRLDERDIARVRALTAPCVVRERCRIRRLRVR